MKKLFRLFHFKYQTIYGYFVCWWRRSNCLRTGLKCGCYDKDILIPEAIFCAVDDFVSKSGEDAFSIVDWNDRPSSERARKRIIKILHWYHVERKELESKRENLIDELYKKKEKRVLFMHRDIDETLKIYKVQEIEREIYYKNVYYSKMACSILEYLWC